MAFYKDTIRRREGFKKLFDCVRVSRLKWQTKVHLEGAFCLEHALNKPEITFWLEVAADTRDYSLEMFEMMRMAVRKGHRNPRCVVTVMAMGKVENLARMSLEHLQEFIGENLAIVVFENVELFMSRMRLKNAMGDACNPAFDFHTSIRKEDGSTFPNDWPVEKRLWEMRVKGNYLEEYALNNESLTDPDMANTVKQDNSIGESDSIKEKRALQRVLQEELTEVFGFSRWVPVNDLLQIYEVRVSGMLNDGTSPPQLQFPVPHLPLYGLDSRYPQVVERKVSKDGEPMAVSDGQPCPWCALAVAGCCFAHSSADCGL